MGHHGQAVGFATDTGSVLTSYLAAVAALALLTILPGPDVAIVTRFALAGGRTAGICAASGVGGGLVLWGAMTVVGLAAVLAASATAYAVVKLAGALFLIGVGIRVLWWSRSGLAYHVDAPRVPVSHPVRSGLLTNVLNPKIAVFYTSLLPSLVPSGGAPRTWLPILAGTHALLSFVWLTGYAAALASSPSLIARPGVSVLLDRITGCVLVGLGLQVATEVR